MQQSLRSATATVSPVLSFRVPHIVFPLPPNPLPYSPSPYFPLPPKPHTLLPHPHPLLFPRSVSLSSLLYARATGT